MKIVSFDDIKKLDIAPQICYQWVCEMIAQKKSVLLPEKINMKLSEKVYCNVMPCVLECNAEQFAYTWGGGKSGYPLS